MNTTDFTYLINNPKEINKEYTKQLEDVINAFPYFQTARALYLKGLKNQDSFRYNLTLKTTAAYTTDRSVLFDFITSSFFTDDTKNPKEIDAINIESIEVIHKNLADIPITSEKKESIEFLEIGKPIQFKNNESHSFNQWLQLNTLKPINRDAKKIEVKKEKVDLVDQFIAKNPKIKPLKSGVYNPIILKNEQTDYNNLMTETLAKVYLEQKKYKNAIKAYRILSLKYPEKSSIFAHRIKAIKLLDKN